MKSPGKKKSATRNVNKISCHNQSHEHTIALVSYNASVVMTGSYSEQDSRVVIYDRRVYHRLPTLTSL